jgi:hypothetical protein
VLLARRRRGLGEGIEESALSVMDVIGGRRPAGTGTMAEAGGAIEVIEP